MKLSSVACLVSLLSLPVYAEILSVHCPQGCPSSPSINDLVFTHIYALSNNPKTKFADWVAYEVNPINYGISPGRNWKSSPLIDEADSLEKSDYSGANASQLKADRGHQAPLATFAGSRYWYEANYLSNITPQNKELNQGPWKLLEDKVREVASYEEPIFVFTGPIYQSNMPSLPKADEEHQIPSGYFKVIYDTNSSIGFIMNQNSQRDDTLCSKLVDISDIKEKILFELPELPEGITFHRKLGCL